MKKTDRVEILVATYNGAAYLPTLLESILNQTYPNLHIVIRDDGSKDGTPEILQTFAQAHPNKISLINDNKANLGVISNFSELIAQSKAPYIFLSDQDDKWLPNKVQSTMDLLKSIEQKYGSDTPLLAHTDLTVVDHNLNEIHPSFWGYSNLNPNNDSTNRLLVQNFIAGCTMGMNRALANLLHPIPNDVMMHDWWIALVASCFGHISRLNESTILYRQHQGNTLGAQKFQWQKVFTVFFKKENVIKDRPKVQAARLLERYENTLSPHKKELISAYVEIKSKSFIRQRQQILKYGFYRHGFLRSIRTIVRPFKY